MQNWAGIHTFRAADVARPDTADAVAGLVRSAGRVRGLGTRHCFNDIADTPGLLISTERLTGVRVDPATRTATVEAGVTYGRLGPVLHAAGLALPNLASLPHITVAGSVATATHGSGERLGTLSTAVAAVELVTADGNVRAFRRGDPDFDGVVVHLGRLGVVTRLTLDLVPAFDVEQTVYDRVPMDAFLDRLDDVAAGAYSVSGFTDWQDHRFTQVWVKSLAGVPHVDLRDLGGEKADAPRHPLQGRAGNVASEGVGADACTRQLGVPGPWHERLPHFRMAFTPSSGAEIQSEFFVPRAHAKAAVLAVAALRDTVGPVLQVSEVRLVAADDFWMSPCYRRASVAVHFTWRLDMAGVAAALPVVEAALAAFDARPHWGKVFAATNVADRLPRAADFRRLRDRLDPQGMFANAFCERAGV